MDNNNPQHNTFSTILFFCLALPLLIFGASSFSILVLWGALPGKPPQINMILICHLIVLISAMISAGYTGALRARAKRSWLFLMWCGLIVCCLGPLVLMAMRADISMPLLSFSFTSLLYIGLLWGTAGLYCGVTTKKMVGFFFLGYLALGAYVLLHMI